MNRPSSHVAENGDVWLRFDDTGGRVVMRFSAIVRGGRGYEARCEVHIDNSLEDMGRVDLLNVRERDFLAERLGESAPYIGPDWSWRRAFVLCADALRNHFGGSEKLVNAESIAYTEMPPPLIDPVIDDTINVWAGHGGSLKSIISIMAAYQIATGHEIIGANQQALRNALILDYEEVEDDIFGYRYRMIRQLYPRPDDACDLYYRNETMPITETADTIRRLCDQHQIGFVVLDPFINARGGDAKSDTDTQIAIAAIRSLRRPVLIIDHLRKDDGKGTGQDSPFGSVFTRNLSRSVWTVSRKDETSNQVEFVDRKANHRRRGGPVEYDVRWDAAGIGVSEMRRDGLTVLRPPWAWNPPVTDWALDAFR